MYLPELSERYRHILDQREEFPADGHFRLDNKPSTCCIYIYTFSLFLNFGVFHISTPFTIQAIVYKNFLLLIHVNKTQDIAKKDVVDNIWSYVIWSWPLWYLILLKPIGCVGAMKKPENAIHKLQRLTSQRFHPSRRFWKREGKNIVRSTISYLSTIVVTSNT